MRLYRARTRPKRKLIRTRLLSSFAIQKKHEPERGQPSKAFDASRLFLAVRDKIWNHGAGRVRHGGDNSTVFVINEEQ